MPSKFKLSKKYIDFCKEINTSADFLEGTTASGKTTVGAGVKFMLKVSASKKKLHIIAGRTTGVVEKNILQQDNGILDIHRNAQYFGNGDKDFKLPHVKFEDKIILILGYDNKNKWENVLGGQYGCVLIDEINTADIDFVREISTRNDYLLATLNPDNPELPVYSEFINRSRPQKKYAKDVPAQILDELKEPPAPNWRYWFFSFKDNLGLTDDDIKRRKESAPPGTKLYKNKIEGLRGKATGLVFNCQNENIITSEQAKSFKYTSFSCGVDTSYSQQSDDTFAFIYIGLTTERKLVILAERVYNNRDLSNPLSPSDIPERLINFLEVCRNEYGFGKNVFIDSADAATVLELKKYKKINGSVYSFTEAWKETKIIDRLNLQIGWMAKGDYLIVDTCKEHIKELNTYSWQENKDMPEDGNDHTINACQYGWLPQKGVIGSIKKAKEE